jgi:preprotein translocase subunit SecD
MMRSTSKKGLFILAIFLGSIIAICRLPLHLGLDLQGGTSLILQVKAESAPPSQLSQVVEQTRQVLERRINAFGLSETTIQPYGDHGDELLVQIPGVTDVSRVEFLLRSQGVLEWYAVSAGPYPSKDEALAQYGGVIPDNLKLFATKPYAGTEQTWYLLHAPPVIKGTDLRDAHAATDEMNQPVTTFTLGNDAAERFQRYTETNVGRRSAIVLDKEIVSVPVIENAIRDTGQIRGAHSLEAANDLAISLRSGALPAAITILQERTVEASLGADSIHSGVMAASYGLLAVVAAIMFYYRSAGINAAIALFLNGLLLVAVLSWLGAVLTLPGIAGAVLTIGMAVDSNVLIFERIREELRSGKSASMALDVGFSKAFATLVDTHVTTVVSCIVLFFFGTPTVKGFASVLIIGLTTNLFTSVFISRFLFDWELTRQGPRPRLRIGMV